MFRLGKGVALPRPLKELRPNYTTAAISAKIQGNVFLECVVNTDGTVVCMANS